MAKLLVSWLAFNNDFIRNESGAFEKVNTDGPNYQFHQHFYKNRKFDKHILLYSTAKQEGFAERLGAKIRGDFKGHIMEEVLVPLQNVIDLNEVKTRTEDFLLQHSSDEMEIFFSPGTSIMQLSWYICHQSLGLNTRLIQTKAAKFSVDGLPELMEIEVQQSETPVTAIIRENSLNRGDEQQGDYLLTDSVREVYNRAYLVAQTDKVTTIIRGESGTGKEHLARYIHDNSIRKTSPFMAVNCAALTESLLESRLFGAKKGAFTGADKDQPGYFALASGGTIFLDEIGDISQQLQQSLLRVLQDKEIQPIGGTPVKVDVRVIAATNAPLEQYCREGRFRWDLYYRLAIAELELPALQDRGRSEVSQLFDHFVIRKKTELHKTKALKFTKDARQILLNYPFPGNVRELENLVESLYVFCHDEVKVNDLPKRMHQVGKEHSLRLQDAEQEHIVKVLRLMEGNQRQTAITLGISINTLKSKLKQYGLNAS